MNAEYIKDKMKTQSYLNQSELEYLLRALDVLERIRSNIANEDITMLDSLRDIDKMAKQYLEHG